MIGIDVRKGFQHRPVCVSNEEVHSTQRLCATVFTKRLSKKYCPRSLSLAILWSRKYILICKECIIYPMAPCIRNLQLANKRSKGCNQVLIFWRRMKIISAVAVLSQITNRVGGFAADRRLRRKVQLQQSRIYRLGRKEDKMKMQPSLLKFKTFYNVRCVWALRKNTKCIYFLYMIVSVSTAMINN